MCLVTIKVVKAEDMDMEFLSNHFTNFFKNEPWSEYVFCPRCKRFDDFGPAYSWGEETTIDRCPDCNSKLSLYWSKERLRLYLTRKPTVCYIAMVDANMAAWAFVYEMTPSIVYIDTVTILPQYRKIPGIAAFLKEFDISLNSLETKYTTILSRTHKRAKKVRRVLSMLGFKEGEVSKEDPDRLFWIRRSKKRTVGG